MSDLRLTIQALLQGTLSKDADHGEASYAINLSEFKRLTSGTGDNQGNEYVDDRRSLTGGAGSETIDLTSTLTNALGETVSLTKLKGLYIHNRETVDGRNLTISGNALSMLTGAAEHVIPPDGVYLITAPLDGWTITNTTQDQLTLAQGANDVTYDIALWGLT